MKIKIEIGSGQFEQLGETQRERKKQVSLSYEERDTVSNCLKIQLYRLLK